MVMDTIRCFFFSEIVIPIAKVCLESTEVQAIPIDGKVLHGINISQSLILAI